MLFLTLYTCCSGEKLSYDVDDFTPLLGDLRSAESEEKRSILKSLKGDSDDSKIAEESRREKIEIRVVPGDKKEYPSVRSRKANGKNKTHDVVQWHATPSRIVEHHLEGDESESNIGSYNDNEDLNSQNSGYDDQNHVGNHYHVDHHHYDEHPSTDENQDGYTSYNHQNHENKHDVPTSDVFYKKLKLKKVRRNCTRSKVKKIKKEQVWPEISNTDIQSRSNNGIVLPHVNTEVLQQSLPALPEARFNEVPKTLHYPAIPADTVGFSGEHLHGIPRTHFFHYKNGEGINHYHLHNHNHIYDANGKRINIGYSPQYRNLAQNFGKLKSMLTTEDPPNTDPYSNAKNHYRSTISLGDSESKPSTINGNNQGKGYHYTGAHESYGQQYKNIYPSTKTTSSSTSIDDHDKSIGMEMYRYGAGQYGTDEFSSQEEKFYPNEVKYGIDKPYPNSRENYESVREKPYSDYQSSPNSAEYGNRNTHSSTGSPYSSYSSDYGHSYDHRGKEDKYNQNTKQKSPFDSQDKAPYTPQDKAPFTPQDKPSYGPSSHITGPSSAEFHDGIRTGQDFRGQKTDALPNSNSYPEPYGPTEGQNGPSAPSSDKPEEPSSQEYSGPKTMDITHSVSYSQDGDIETVDLGPENLDLYKNLRPEPDPLTIPKNARIFEHYIRLHPMHYMYAAMARSPMNIPNLYGTLGYPVPLHKHPAVLPKYPAVLPKYPAALPKYPATVPKYPAPLPKYPVPLHKLMLNPLKMPAMIPAAPLYPRVPIVPQWNPMLAYQGRALYHGWW